MDHPSTSSASAAVTAFMNPFSSRKNSALPRTSLDDDDDEGSDSASLGLSKKKPQFYSEYFKRYELMIEFTNLRNPNHCPLGVYVMPAQDNLNSTHRQNNFIMYRPCLPFEAKSLTALLKKRFKFPVLFPKFHSLPQAWFGSLFVHKGYYRNGVFKFRISIPPEYPERAPTVDFLTDMFHPLVDQKGGFNMGQQFPAWRPHQDYIFHVLHYIKNAFKKVVLDNLLEKYAKNKEAYRMYHNEPHIFANLAQQCAQLSITESILFENFPESNMIRFTSLKDGKFGEYQVFDCAGGSADNKTLIEQQLKDRFNDFRNKSMSG
ncbi:hypothetical protein BC937DRAFT_88233 [Endogone sp. FLAS-F59071]|nr:hypothetical protein BC937DRAFT_88233 [Endogone sp. FLAS-F59071]|eukprot:RUS22628.1 hypothetical protein BC937DRAFT_88233 [Endogone sp. FLAS-F59071]